MLPIAAILFALNALGGTFLAVMHIQKKQAPIPLAVIHGVVAAAGLVLLIIAILQAQLGGLVLVALVLFIIAALGGLVLFVTHLRARPLSAPLIFIHGGVAATAFLLLLVYMFR